MDNEIDGFSIAHALYAFVDDKDIDEHDNTNQYLDMFRAAGFEPVNEDEKEI